MSWEGWLTLVIVLATIVAMVRDLVAPAVAVLGATTILLLVGVIDSDEAFAGFSNSAPLTVAVMYVLAAAASKSGVLQPLISRSLDARAGDRRNLARLLFPVAAASSALNNTPIVAALVPEVSSWAARHGKALSRFLMPISFAAILGGTVTLIGTSTNLVVSGLLEAAGHEPLGFFELAPVGLPVAVAGVALVVLAAPRVLPDRGSTRRELTELAREFVVDLRVIAAGPLDGSTVESGGLRHQAGVFLVQLERSGDSIAPVAPTTRLRGGDRLRFAGKADNVIDLLAIPGLESGEDEVVGFDVGRSSFFEAVVGSSSPLVGRTLRQSEFRGLYQAAVVAIHRAGERVDAKLGEVHLRVGDTLVLLADPGFHTRWRDRRDFLLVSPLGATPPPVMRHRLPVALIFTAVVLLASLTPMPILHAALLGALAVLVLGILTPGEARNAIDLDVILLIAGGFGLGEAMVSSGLADVIADGVVGSLGELGPVGALAGVAVATVVLTEMISNAAAAIILFPIALATAAGLGLDPRGFAVAVAISASASFLTPIGYQTNVMVYGPGGYRFGDYARLGLPITLLVLGTVLAVVPVAWPL